jgi:hypothetical protein
MLVSLIDDTSRTFKREKEGVKREISRSQEKEGK